MVTWVGSDLSAGRYHVNRLIGEGGMGEVYLADDRNLDTEVVIKVPHPMALVEPGFAALFEREARSLVQLAHPHIVRVLEVGRHQEVPFSVMQFLPGGSVETRRPRRPDGQRLPCSPGGLRGWLPAIAGALDFVHARGFLHRDVKPTNILFDSHGYAYLSDFGLAKALALADTGRKAGFTTGRQAAWVTPEYMAPERILGDSYDGRADQYALAVTLYELLAARPPFEGQTPMAVMSCHLHDEPPPLDGVNGQVSGELSRAVHRALDKAPQNRYPNCAALSQAVTAAAESLVLSKQGAKSTILMAGVVEPLASDQALEPASEPGTDRTSVANSAAYSDRTDPPRSNSTRVVSGVSLSTGVAAKSRRIGRMWIGGGLVTLLAVAALTAILTQPDWLWNPPSAGKLTPKTTVNHGNPTPPSEDDQKEPKAPCLEPFPREQSVNEEDPFKFTPKLKIPGPGEGPVKYKYELLKVTRDGKGIDSRDFLARLRSDTGEFVWTPTEEQGPARYAFTIRVALADHPELGDEKELTVKVEEVATAPTLVIPKEPIQGYGGVPLRYEFKSGDRDVPRNKLRYEPIGPPLEGAELSREGVLTWKPDPSQSGKKHTIGVKVAVEGKDRLQDTQNYTIVVKEYVGPLHVFRQHASEVLSVALNRDASKALSGDRGGFVHVCNLKNNEMIGPPIPCGAAVNALAISPVVEAFYTGHPDGTWIGWELDTIKRHGPCPTGFPVLSLSISPDGKFMISGGAKEAFFFYKLFEDDNWVFPVRRQPDWIRKSRFGKQVPNPRVGGTIPSVALSRDANWALLGYSDGRIGFAGREGRNRSLADTQRPIKVAIRGLAISDNGDRFVSGSEDGTLRVWHPNGADFSNATVKYRLNEPGAAITSVALSGDGQRALTGCTNGSVMLWNVVTGDEIKFPKERHKDEVTSVALSSDGRIGLSGSKDQTVILWSFPDAGTPLGGAAHD